MDDVSAVPAGELSGTRVAVVGAGFTGLVAAWRLAVRGADVTLIEAGPDVGGLAAGCEILGRPVERAYHFLYRTDEHMIALLEELGMRERLSYHRSSVSTFYDGTLYPMENPVDLLRFTPLSFVNRIRAGVSVLWLQRVRDWRPLTGISAMDWLTKFAGKQVVDVIWAPLLRGKFDKYYDDVTMCWLWGRIKQRVESRDPKLGGEALGYIEGGFVTVIDEVLRRYEAAGGRVRLSSPVRRLSAPEQGGPVTLETDAGAEDYDRVLLTVPSNVADRLLEPFHARRPAWFDKLRSVDYLDAAVLLFATDKPISRFYWHNINTPNSPFVVFLSLTSLIGTERFGGKHVYYIGDYVPREHPYMSDSEEALTDKWFGALASMFPDFDRGSVIESKAFRFANAQHIVDVGFEERIVEHRTPAPGVYLCNFSQIFPMDRGTNYAVRDGSRMAELIAGDVLGRTDTIDTDPDRLAGTAARTAQVR